MKKLALSLLSIMLVAMLCVGCTPTEQAAPRIDDPLPWFAYRTFSTETSKYTVRKHFMIDEETSYSVNNESLSYLTYTLTQWTDESNTALIKVETDFSITYTDSEYLEPNYCGKTDIIKSTVVFRADNLAAVSSEKKVSLTSNPNLSYEYHADYTQGVTTFTFSDRTQEMTFPKGNYIDNEYLYYYVRSMTNMGTSLNEAFYVVNWYECCLNGEFFVAPMRASYYTAESAKITSSLLDGFDAQSKDTEQSTVMCNLVQIMLNSEKAGAPLYAYYTTSPYQIESNKYASKLLAKVRTYENDLDGTITYRTDYELSEFKTTFKTSEAPEAPETPEVPEENS